MGALSPGTLENEWKDVSTASNLFTEAISASRTCEDAGIPPWYCSCLDYVPVDIAFDHQLADLLATLVAEAARVMNSLVYSPVHRTQLCGKLEPSEIVEVFGIQANRYRELLKVVFRLKSRPEAKIIATYMISPRPYGSGIKPTHMADQYARPEPILYRGFYTYATILGLSRLDPFEGQCAVKARKQEVKADFCFCD